MGTDLDNLFGHVAKITLVVEEEELEEPEVREEDPDDFEFVPNREEDYNNSHENDFFAQVSNEVKR